MINANPDLKACLQLIFSYMKYSPPDDTLKQLFHKLAPISEKEKLLYAIPPGRRRVVYGDFIEEAAREGEYEKAKKAFKQAERRGCLTDRAYASFVSFAYREGKYKDAKSVLEEAKGKNRLGVDLRARLMEIARNANKHDDVKAIFDEAKAQNCLDEQGIPETVRFAITPPSCPGRSLSTPT